MKIEFPIALCLLLNLWPCLQQRMEIFFLLGRHSRLGGVEESVKKPVKMIKSKDTALIHLISYTFDPVLQFINSISG